MTLYLIRHAATDYRLHEADGTETGDSWAWDIDWLDAEARTDDMESSVQQAVAGEPFRYRDLTIEDETVPW